MERLTMYSRGIEVVRSSNDATPSVKAKVESRMRFTWRATMRPISLFCEQPGPDQRVADAELAVALQVGLGLAVLLGGDAALGDQRLAQPVLLQVAGGEDRAAVVEEDGLDRAARLHLQVPAAALDGKLPQGLGDRGDGEVGEHRGRAATLLQIPRRSTPSQPAGPVSGALCHNASSAMPQRRPPFRVRTRRTASARTGRRSRSTWLAGRR